MRKKLLVVLGLSAMLLAGHLLVRELFRRSVLEDGDDALDVFDI